MRTNKKLRIVRLRASGGVGRLVQDAEKKTRFLEAGTGRYLTETLPVVTENDISETTLNEKIIYLKMEISTTNKCINEHVINDGEYVILEVLYKTPPTCHLYHTYVNFIDTCKGYQTLDSALIGLLEYKYQGNNSQAGEMFERMLEMDKKNIDQPELGDGE